MVLVLRRLPIDKKRDRILRLSHTVIRFTSGNAGCGACDNAGWNGDILQDPTANIDMVR